MNTHQSILSKISNTLFITLVTFILSFIWINYYIRNMNCGLIFASISTIIILSILFIIKIIIKPFKSNKLIKQTRKEYLITQLLLGNNTTTIKSLIKTYHLENLTKITQNHLIDKINKIDYFFLFNSLKINEQDIIQITKEKIYNNLTIFCIENGSFPTIENLNITYENIDKIYKQLVLNSSDIDYKIKIIKKPKYSFKEVICAVLNNSKSRGYLSFGLMLIFTSLFTIYSTYYIVFGTILILLSIYTKFNKRFN